MAVSGVETQYLGREPYVGVAPVRRAGRSVEGGLQGLRWLVVVQGDGGVQVLRPGADFVVSCVIGVGEASRA